MAFHLVRHLARLSFRTAGGRRSLSPKEASTSSSPSPGETQVKLPYSSAGSRISTSSRFTANLSMETKSSRSKASTKRQSKQP